MRLATLFVPGGTGVIATAGKGGTVNTAIYAPPMVMDDETVAWGMTDGRTYDNIRANPNAAFLYRAPGDGYRGVRLALVLARIEDSGKTLQSVKASVGWSVNPHAAEAIRHVAFFKVVEKRPLI